MLIILSVYLGYEIVYKHCGCSCGHGYLRKDLDWVPPALHRYLSRCHMFIHCLFVSDADSETESTSMRFRIGLVFSFLLFQVSKNSTAHQ
jgi:hypothetical protein